jgi:hypothetical protein
MVLDVLSPLHHSTYLSIEVGKPIKAVHHLRLSLLDVVDFALKRC